MTINADAPQDPACPPGILLATGRFLDHGLRVAEVPACRHERLGGEGTSVHRMGDWLIAFMVPSAVTTERSTHVEPALTVLLDGYVSDVEGSAITCESRKGLTDADLVAMQYQNFGIGFTNKLRGSFTALILDHARDRAFLLNDRQGSRPLFIFGEHPDGLLVAPGIRHLVQIRGKPAQLNIGAIGEFLVRGCYYGSDTVFEGIRKLPLATITTIDRPSLKTTEYWRPCYRRSGSRSIPEVLDAFDSLAARATRRLLDRLKGPALLLSGGLDSRLMLAYANAEGPRLPCFTYHVEGSRGDDHTIAQRVAALTGNTLSTYPIPISDYQSAALKEAIAADGRVQIIDAPSSRWDFIGSLHQSMFIGDESFGWKAHVTSPGEALDSVGWWNIDASPRISDWLRPGVRERIRAHIERCQTDLMDICSESSADDLKDHLYYRERMGNLLNGFSARRLRVAEQARPFLDEDLIDFLFTVPAELRCDKKLARLLMQTRFPEIDAIPYASKTSVPWDEADFVCIVRETPSLRDFILRNLDADLDERLAEVFDRARLAETTRKFFSGEKLPPLRSEWWTAIPGAWRLSRQKQDRVGTLRGLLRVLQINLYLTHQAV